MGLEHRVESGRALRWLVRAWSLLCICRVHIQRSRPESEPRDHVTGLLLVLEGSRGDHRVLEYGVRLRHRCPDARIGLLQLLASLPPELLEFGGAEDPD